jgi:hypothetical protein
MSCDINKFVISKGVNNNFTFTIKQDNSTLPLSIEAADTFLADLVPLGPAFAFGEEMPVDTFNNITMVVEDALNGKISLSISESDTQWLVIDKGERVDRYYTRPTYKILLKCNTANNGDFVAKVPEVYVD